MDFAGMDDCVGVDLMDEKYTAKLRYQALEECLEIIEAMRRNFSQGSGITPREGYEMAWARENIHRMVVQQMMREQKAAMAEEEKLNG